MIYNIFDQSPQDQLFSACEKHNVGVIVRVALDEGGLTGRITPESTFEEEDFRNHYFQGNRKQEVYSRVQQMAEELDVEVDNFAEIALRFVLSHSAVSTVIPGMRSVRNVERNMSVGDGKGLPADQLAKLAKHRWVRNFYAGLND